MPEPLLLLPPPPFSAVGDSPTPTAPSPPLPPPTPLYTPPPLTAVRRCSLSPPRSQLGFLGHRGRGVGACAEHWLAAPS